jgi:hypothetical protein
LTEKGIVAAAEFDLEDPAAEILIKVKGSNGHPIEIQRKRQN